MTMNALKEEENKKKSISYIRSHGNYVGYNDTEQINVLTNGSYMKTNTKSGGLLLVSGLVLGLEVDALLDTGAAINLLSQRSAFKLNFSYNEHMSLLRGATNCYSISLGKTCDKEISVYGEKCVTDFHIGECDFDVILGIPRLKRMNAGIFFCDNDIRKISLNNKIFEISCDRVIYLPIQYPLNCLREVGDDEISNAVEETTKEETLKGSNGNFSQRKRTIQAYHPRNSKVWREGCLVCEISEKIVMPSKCYRTMKSGKIFERSNMGKLIEFCRLNSWRRPSYRVVSRRVGKDNYLRYEYMVIVNNFRFKTFDSYKTKKDAKQAAALVCLRSVENHNINCGKALNLH